MKDQSWGWGPHRLDVTAQGVEVLGNYRGPNHAQFGGRVTHQQYIDGQYNAGVKNDFTEEIHLEVLALCRAWVAETDKDSR